MKNILVVMNSALTLWDAMLRTRPELILMNAFDGNFGYRLSVYEQG